jgi:hypothetical protein
MVIYFSSMARLLSTLLDLIYNLIKPHTFSKQLLHTLNSFSLKDLKKIFVMTD